MHIETIAHITKVQLNKSEYVTSNFTNYKMTVRTMNYAHIRPFNLGIIK